MDAITTAAPAYWDTDSLTQKRTAEEAAKGFESLFVHMMLAEARKGMPEGFLGRSNASRMFYDMFDMQVAQEIAASGSLGLAATISEALEAYGQPSVTTPEHPDPAKG